ncbi:DUF899 family protein [Nesterenkonia haasae]|uniref:DUF899 family protein n=1 Tax=Nesterenkonia haasae TaxID=2587813 RepID=UPI00139128F5|nr:DUF899 family protein [Nesterenkonia haasae]NDK30237.1 DUF899 domain-containing protein [Nesterenkonia haasae]
MALPRIVESSEWHASLSKQHAKEKALTRQLDDLAADRRRLPMVELPPYTLRGGQGETSLLDAFEGRRQLITYHFMWNPGAEDQCSGCTWFASHIATLEPLHARDTTFAVVTVGPWEEADAYRARFGWTMPWYSAAESSFGADVGAGRGQGFALNVFLREGERVFRTYYTTGRGAEQFTNTWALLDLTPWGRQEAWQEVPSGRPQGDPYTWWPEPSDYEAEYKRAREIRAG